MDTCRAAHTASEGSLPTPAGRGRTLGWRQTPLLLAPPRPQALPDLAQVAHPHGPQLPHLLSGRNEGPFLCARGGNCCLWAGAFVNCRFPPACGRGLGIAVAWLQPVLADQAAGARLHVSGAASHLGCR